jgi:enoyl-CoA hydratase
MTAAALLIERRGSALWLTLNRPEKLNAISSELRDLLGDAIEAVASDSDVRVLIITGAGRAFSVGGDLAEFSALADEGRFDALHNGVRRMSAIISAVEQAPIPVIAAVNGLAVAGGLELALACDVIVASRDAKLGDGHINYGVLPGGGASVRLARRLPENVARYLLLTGSLEPAEQFVRWGLIAKTVPSDRLVAETETLAGTLANHDRSALAAVKALIRSGRDLPLTDALKEEIRVFESHTTLQEFRDGLSSFVKRTASPSSRDVGPTEGRMKP